MNYLKLIKISALMAVFLIPMFIGITLAENKQVLGDSTNQNDIQNSKIKDVRADSTSIVEESLLTEGPTRIYSEVIKQTAQNPEAEKTKDSESDKLNFKVPASKYDYQLHIPRIAISSPVSGLGLTSDGLMAVPDNYTEVGWYSLGTKPGNIGSAVLGAHVDDGGNTAGVFKNLKTLKIGDDIYLTDKAGKTLHFKITARNIYDYRMPDTSPVFGSNGKRMLRLITCYGNFLPSENTYDERLVVSAELQS